MITTVKNVLIVYRLDYIGYKVFIFNSKIIENWRTNFKI